MHAIISAMVRHGLLEHRDVMLIAPCFILRGKPVERAQIDWHLMIENMPRRRGEKLSDAFHRFKELGILHEEKVAGRPFPRSVETVYSIREPWVKPLNAYVKKHRPVLLIYRRKK